MIIKSILNEEKEFSNKEELIKYVKDNIDTIIDYKKGTEQKSIDKGASVSCRLLNDSRIEVANKAIKTDDDYYYIAVNTTRVLDNHDDLHVNGIWNKTAVEQQGRNYLVDTHSLSIGSTIVRKEDIEMFVAKTTFASLRLPYDGSTQVLVYKFRKDRVIDRKAKEWLESGDSIEASVRMQYVSIEFALDSNAPEDAKAKANYDTYINEIANKDDFEYIPYFFVIKEAKNIKESSLCPFGSNSATGNIISRKKKDNEPSTADTRNDNHKKEPSNDTQKELNKFTLNQFY